MKRKSKQKVFTLGEKTKIFITEYLAEYRSSDEWLQNNIRFDADRYLNETYKTIAYELFYSLQLEKGYKSERKIIDFEILLANLLLQPKKPVSISLNQNDYKQTKYSLVSYTNIKNIIDTLHKMKYLSIKGGFNYNNEPDSRLSRIWATEKLLSVFPEYENAVSIKPFQLVVLKNDKGELMDYKETKETWRIRDILQAVNNVNAKADIRYDEFKLNGFLTAIFINKFTLYGRLHTKGYKHYQGLSGKKKNNERAEITINGYRTIELDYSGLGPNLLYAKENIQYLGDPYSIIDPRPEVRAFLKHVLICMQNSDNETKALKAANYWLFQNKDERILLNEIGITTAKPLIEKFKEEHKPISKYFFKGKNTGLRIMNADSKIALDVINHFAKKNISILSIHDSFIVQAQYKIELYNTMKAVYKKHTGFDINIK